MRLLTYFFLALMLISASCASLNKNLRKGNKAPAETTAAVKDEKTDVQAGAPIREVEETLVPNASVMPSPRRFFVIIGSFRSLENSYKYQEQIRKEGFNSEILKNAEGLFRISVLSTDDIDAARTEIRRIRTDFPKYYDTWLLVQKK